MSETSWPRAGRRVRVEPAVLLPSPAFASHYPRVRNLELIDPGPRNAMEQSWKRGVFPAGQIEVFDLPGAYVIDECLVLDRHLQIIENASDIYSEAEIARAIAAIQAHEAAHTLPHYDRPGIVSKRRAANNYGHFLMEMLPMAVLGQLCAGTSDVWYIVHHVLAPTLDAVFRAFRLLGVPMSRVLVPTWSEPVWFDRLIIVRGLTSHGTFMSPLALFGTERLVQALIARDGGIPDPRYERIFVRRVPGWGRGRDMHNEEEVARRLGTLGFVDIEPGVMSLEEQIHAFASARHVVGVVGAAMTNIAFCRPATKVTMLCPGTFPDTFFWYIATHRQLDYLEIRGDQTVTEGLNSWEAGSPSGSPTSSIWRRCAPAPADWRSVPLRGDVGSGIQARCIADAWRGQSGTSRRRPGR